MYTQYLEYKFVGSLLHFIVQFDGYMGSVCVHYIALLRSHMFSFQLLLSIRCICKGRSMSWHLPIPTPECVGRGGDAYTHPAMQIDRVWRIWRRPPLEYEMKVSPSVGLLHWPGADEWQERLHKHWKMTTEVGLPSRRGALEWTAPWSAPPVKYSTSLASIGILSQSFMKALKFRRC